MPITLEDLEREALPTLIDYATIESISSAYDHDWAARGELLRAARLLEQWARSRALPGAVVTLHELEGRSPVLTVVVPATAPVDGTVLLYGHLDKQPPLGEWSEGLGPFTPVRRGNRLYARGVADDGYATFAALLALEDLEARGVPHARCVVLIEASEESGSPDLDAHLAQLDGVLGDVKLLVCLDSGALTYDRLWVTSSLRGNLIVHLTVEVLTRGVHSGSGSGVVPSSFRVLRELLDRLEDSRTGEIRLAPLRAVIPEPYRLAASRVTEEFGDLLADDMPVVEGLRLVGANGAERILNQTWSPTLSVTGVEGIPPVGEAGNVLRPFTKVVLSLRLPPTTNGEAAAAAVIDALTTDPPSGAQVTAVVENVAEGWVCPPLAPWLDRALRDASESAFGRTYEFAGEGGTIPFLAILGQKFPGVQFVATGVLGPDSNAHGIDEMLDLEMCVGVTNVVAHLIAAHAKEAT